MDGNLSVIVSKDIEDEANAYFQSIYNLAPDNSSAIDKVLEMLKKYQISSIKHEKVIIL